MENGGFGSAQTLLSELKAGERGLVLRLELPPRRAAELRRLGLIPGTELLCLRRSPLGEPTAYRWRGIDVALRRRDAERIKVIRNK